eukprot:m.357473 g.357473  ORF g.357473 m.357473 type:complete len:850 (+) comp17855_c0_seq1:1828-4377(+)
MPKQQKRDRNRRRGQLERVEISNLEKLTQEDYDTSELTRFHQYPISSKTLHGLKTNGFTKPTEIQKDALKPALAGKDILGAAKTGSGKTLAFLIPLLETLYKQRFTKADGVGAIVISPTRELALQTYQCLGRIGIKHDMSAGLVIGGKELKREQEIVVSTNIIICTPGRLLQHLDETPTFECNNLKALVLDEADRILDLGFSRALNAILAHLPVNRQTMLFSATQTSKISDLARLSLKDPVYISVHDGAKFATPNQLTQAYMVVDLEKKLDLLYSFIKTHTKQKTIVFVSSGKQVRFIYETFRRVQPGVPLMELHGKQKQLKRVAIFKDFSKKKAAVLFATDIAARGLDIPAVDWVVQVDCPDSVDSYIHRVGRTARYNRDGKALLFLLPSEKKFLAHLEKKRIPVTEMAAADAAVKTITPKLQGFCASDQDVFLLAKKCFVCYMRSVYLQPDKEVFDVTQLPAAEFAQSIGLPRAPKIKFLKTQNAAKNKSRDVQHLAASDFGSKKKAIGQSAATLADDEDEGAAAGKKAVTRLDRLRGRQTTDVLAKYRAGQDEDEDSDDFLQPSANPTHLRLEPAQKDATVKVSKKSTKVTLASVKKSELGANVRIEFDEDGVAHEVGPKLAGIDTKTDEGLAKLHQAETEFGEEVSRMKSVDATDKARHQEMIRQRKQEKKWKEKQLRRQAAEEAGMGVELGGVTLGGDSDDSGDDSEGGYTDSDDAADRDAVDSERDEGQDEEQQFGMDILDEDSDVEDVGQAMPSASSSRPVQGGDTDSGSDSDGDDGGDADVSLAVLDEDSDDSDEEDERVASVVKKAQAQKDTPKTKGAKAGKRRHSGKSQGQQQKAPKRK